VGSKTLLQQNFPVFNGGGAAVLARKIFVIISASSIEQLCNCTVSVCLSILLINSLSDVQLVCCSPGVGDRYQSTSAACDGSRQHDAVIRGRRIATLVIFYSFGGWKFLIGIGASSSFDALPLFG